MRFLRAEDADTETILESPEFHVSIASLLNESGCTIPARFLNLFDASPEEIPKFDIKQATTFLNGLIHAENGEWKNTGSRPGRVLCPGQENGP
jgi:hypothetical protein